MKSILSLLAAAWLAAGQLAAQGTPAVQDQTTAILKELSRITGLALSKPVQQETMSRDKLRQFFEQRLKEVVKPEEVRIEELTLKKFGFAPAEFNLEKTTVDLMTEQAAAFYDYRRKKMVMQNLPCRRRRIAKHLCKSRLPQLHHHLLLELHSPRIGE